jgi:quercetin dioxygenase-like cupin family protein
MSEKDNPVIREKVSDGFDRTLAYLDDIMVAVCEFTNGPAIKPDPPHSHHHEQITYVAEGELLFFKGEEEFHLGKGDIITIPSQMSHCIQTLSKKVVLIDSFSPVRKDFLKK